MGAEIDDEPKDTSWSGALKDAWDSLAPEKDAPAIPERSAAPIEPDEGEPGVGEEETPEEKPEPKADRTRDDKGKFVAGPKNGKPTAGTLETPSKAPAKVDPKAPATDPKAPLEQPKPPASRPPQSWKAAERAAWEKMPPEAQAAVARREREAAQAFQQMAPHRQVSERFSQIVSPYMGMLRAEGGDPLNTAENLFQTWAALRSAPPAQKAGLLANIITTFGVDPGAIAQHLQGQPTRDNPPAFDPNQFAQQLEQRIVGNFEQRQQMAVTQHHANRLAEFEAAHDLIDEPVDMANGSQSSVREQMAALIQAGVAHDFDDAYNRVIAMDGRLSGVVQQREAAKQANAVRASTQRARAASSSLRGTPAGPRQRPQSDKSVRGALEEAWDALSGQDR